MKKRRKSFAFYSIAVLSVAGIFGGLGGASAFAATLTTTPTHQVVTQEQSAQHFEQHGGGHHFRRQDGQQMFELAKILKISPSTLRADLKAKESIADIAQKQGVSTATLTSDVESNFQAQLNQRVSSGKMTAAQEQKIIKQFDAHVGDMMNGTGFMGGGHHFRRHGGQQMSELAKILKISPSTLRADLKAKESIADIAQKQGVSTATLTSDVESNFQAQLNQRVSSGKMTAAQEQKIITQFDAHVGDMMNGTGFMGGWHANSSLN